MNVFWTGLTVAGLFAIVSLSVWFGCKCVWSKVEPFVDAPTASPKKPAKKPTKKPTRVSNKARPQTPTKPKAKSSSFSSHEMELFEDIKKNKLSNKEIDSLVRAGILTETLVERFLTKLDTDDKKRAERI